MVVRCEFVGEGGIVLRIGSARVCSIGLLLVIGSTVVLGSDQATQSSRPAIAPSAPCNNSGAYGGGVSGHMADDGTECDCWKCRYQRGCYNRYRQWAICHHDKCMFHWYIRGNGPAIHTRPAGIYWW